MASAKPAAREDPPADDEGLLAAPDDPRPLGEYGLLVATFATIFSLVTAAARRQRRLPERIGPGDVLLGGVATQKLARLVTKEKVTSPVRAPFTRAATAEPGEARERPRGSGVRRAVGELMLCPFCLAQWIAAAYTLGLLFAPRATRLVAAMMSVTAVSDYLPLAYKAAENRREPQ